MNKFTIKYHRITKTNPKVTSSDKIEYCTIDYSEQLVLDGETETLEHIQRIGTDQIISHIYNIPVGVSDLLDNIDIEDFFKNTVGNGPDAITDPLETKDYEVIIDFKDKYQLVIKGTFDKNGLPGGFQKFAESILNFMNFYGTSEILNPSIYLKVKRKSNDHIFYSVEFEAGGKSYYYLSENNTLEIGDLVWVPVGNSDRHTIVKIVNIEYFQEDKIPFPLDKVKYIARKCADDLIDSPSSYTGISSSGKFFCPVYNGDINSHDCDEIYYGAELGWTLDDEVPYLMDTEVIKKKRELCIACKNLKNALVKEINNNN